MRLPIRKAMRLCEADRRLGVRLRGLRVPAEALYDRREAVGEGKVVGVSELLGQSERLVAPLECLRRIATHPQREGHIGEATHFGVLPIEHRMGVVLLGIIEGMALLQVLLSLRKLSPMPEGRTQRLVRF